MPVGGRGARGGGGRGANGGTTTIQRGTGGADREPRSGGGTGTGGANQEPPLAEVTGEVDAMPTTISTMTVHGIIASLGGTKEQRKTDMRGVQVATFAGRIWAKKKFIHSEKDLDFTPNDQKSLCYHCLTSLGYDIHLNRVFWEEYKHIIVHKFNEKRSNVSFAMRVEWTSEWWEGIVVMCVLKFW